MLVRFINFCPLIYRWYKASYFIQGRHGKSVPELAYILPAGKNDGEIIPVLLLNRDEKLQWGCLTCWVQSICNKPDRFLILMTNVLLDDSEYFFQLLHNLTARWYAKLNGPRQANLLLISYASSEGSGEPAHPRSLARTFAARSYKQWVKRNLQTESQIPGPSEWLGMRSWNLSWRNARRHKFAWRGPNAMHII